MVDALKRTPCQLATDLQVSIIHYDRFALLQEYGNLLKLSLGLSHEQIHPMDFGHCGSQKSGMLDMVFRHRRKHRMAPGGTPRDCLSKFLQLSSTYPALCLSEFAVYRAIQHQDILTRPTVEDWYLLGNTMR